MQKFTIVSLCLLSLLTIAGVAISTGQETAAATIQITDAKLGTGVENRLLTGEDSTFTADAKVYLWMRITGATGEALTVTWKNGTAIHSTTLNVGGSPWRTWANKTVAKAGEWTVSVADSKGASLKELTFTVK
jgi:hypothetical protein